MIDISDPTAYGRNPLPVLAAFARQEADLDAVFRALVEFGGWHVPLAHVDEHYQLRTFPTVRWYGLEPRLPRAELWLFTDAQAADRAEAAGFELGQVGSPVAGTALFADPSPDWAFVRVNPYSPPEVTWNVPPEGFAACRVWAAAVAFEQALYLSKGSKDLFRDREEVFAFLHPSGAVLTCPGSGGLDNPAAVVTAPDCERAFLALVPEEVRAGVKRVVATGAKLLDVLPAEGIDGLLVNPAGPAPSAVVPFADLVPLLPGQLPTR